MKDQNNAFTLTLKNVRCFFEEQHFKIRPLTFLVGENSTGKTTVMGCFHTIGNLINRSYSRHFLDTPHFNSEPFLMGSFQEIVSKKAKANKNKQRATFEIGCNLEESNCKYKIYFAEEEKGVVSIIKEARIDFENTGLQFDNKKIIANIKNQSNDGENKFKFDVTDHRLIYDFIREPYFFLHHFNRRYFVRNIRKDKRDLQEKNKKTGVDQKTRQQMALMKVISQDIEKHEYKMRKAFGDNIISLAPIRSKPKRTYDPIREIPDPEGSEIPVTLMKLSNTETDWEPIQKKLIHFGKSSGLFSDITVKKYGKSIGEPFQLQFQVRGFKSNIMDVGYGVNQILPLLVRLFYSQEKNFRRIWRTRFLLQQPEVHLHPKAQAELASLLIESVKAKNSFLIETHSDYMIDRVSIEVRKKNISYKDVSLIYLEHTKEGVKAHNMSFDQQGNLMGAPEGYRAFFKKESDRFLGFED